MCRLLVVIFCTVCCTLTVLAQQSRAPLLTSKFKNADSIFLVSHVLVEGSTDEAIDQNGKSVSLPSLCVDGKLNYQVVKQKVSLTNKQIDTLLSILKVPSRELGHSQGGCFVPHHAIIIVKKVETSFIDLCFHCLSFRASEDISNVVSLHKNNWIRLEKYFMILGLNYGMEQQARR